MIFSKARLAVKVSSYLLENKRRPMTVEEIAEGLGSDYKQVQGVLWGLVQEGMLLTEVKGLEMRYRVNWENTLLKKISDE